MCVRTNAALRNHPTHRHTSLPLASHFNLTCLRVCSPHVSGPSDRLRPSLRPFARRCCVCQALASCGNFIGHRNAASAKPAHLQTRNPARQAVGEGCYPRVTCSTPSTGPDCISLLLHIPLRQATANTAHFYTWRALLMDPCVSRCATNQPRVPP